MRARPCRGISSSTWSRCVKMSMAAKVGRAGTDEQRRDYRVHPDSGGAGSYPRSAGRRIARLCNGMLLGRRSDLGSCRTPWSTYQVAARGMRDLIPPVGRQLIPTQMAAFGRVLGQLPATSGSSVRRNDFPKAAIVPEAAPGMRLGDASLREPRSLGLRTRVIMVRPPERREVPAEVQFEVARNTVTDTADLGTARLGTGLGQG